MCFETRNSGLPTAGLSIGKNCRFGRARIIRKALWVYSVMSGERNIFPFVTTEKNSEAICRDIAYILSADSNTRRAFS